MENIEQNISEDVRKFGEFTQKEVSSSVKELTTIKIEANRKHLQRLVYVNLVNRFDSLIDTLLLKFATSDGDFKTAVLNSLREEPVFRKELYELLTSGDANGLVKKRIETTTTAEYLRERHSSKLRTLLRLCFHWPDSDLDRPRINVNNGKIFEDSKKDKAIPNSIIGYADWLYSRRNTFVHGSPPHLSKLDIEVMKKKFHVVPATTTNLKLSSINSASNFYTNLCDKFKITH